MEVIIHNADLDINIENEKNLGKVFDKLESNGFIILDVIADSQKITNYSNKKIEKIKPIEKLEIVVQDSEELTKDSILEAKEYIPKLIDGINDIINKFNQGLENEGYRMLDNCLEGFQWINVMIVNFNNSDVYATTDELKQIIEKWDKNLKQFLSALENQDIVMVTDILEYEMIPILKKYLKIIKETSK